MLRIITDSASDISQAEGQRLGIDILPLTLNFDGVAYQDGIDIDNKGFFERLRKAEKLPTTSQINPAQFEQIYRPYLEQGDDLLVITISSELSATYSSAKVAAEATYPERVFVLDSLSASLGEELLIREALRRMQKKDYGAAELYAEMKEMVPKIRLFATIETLKYLRMGGRLSSGAALVGEVLGIIPVAHLYEGKIEVLDKVRGEKNAIKKFAELYNSFDIDTEKGIVFSHADAPQKLEKYMDIVEPDYEAGPIYISTIGSAIGTHTGPGLIGVSFFVK